MKIIRLINLQEKNFLNKTYFYCVYHPKKRFRLIMRAYKKPRRYKSKYGKPKCKPEYWFWKFFNEDNNTHKVDDEWVELNLEFPHSKWYIKVLEKQKLKESKEPRSWKIILFALSIKLFNSWRKLKCLIP